LGDAGFEARAFPPLEPILSDEDDQGSDAAGGGWRTLAYRQQVAAGAAWQAGDGGEFEEDSDGNGSGGSAGARPGSPGARSTSHAFAEWAIEEQRLPLLASQWAHGAHRCGHRSQGVQALPAAPPPSFELPA
jgi:hypothetical protein